MNPDEAASIAPSMNSIVPLYFFIIKEIPREIIYFQENSLDEIGMSSEGGD